VMVVALFSMVQYFLHFVRTVDLGPEK
jgi:hypothetical protein